MDVSICCRVKKGVKRRHIREYGWSHVLWSVVENLTQVVPKEIPQFWSVVAVFCSLAWQTLQRWLALKSLKMFMIFSRITQMINILFLYFLTEVALRSRVQLLIYHSPRSIITSSPSILQLCLKKHYSVFKMIELFVTWGESCSYGFCPQELQDSTKKNQNVPRCFKFIFSALQ